MKKKLFSIALAALCLFSAATAQKIKPLTIGDTIPETLWQMPLQVINNPQGKNTITLNDYREKLIILDFWATYCTPCVASVSKLDTLQKQFNNQIKVITVHLFDYPQKALPFIQKKHWEVPCVLGKGDTLLHRSFFTAPRFGEVWIKDGRLIAVPQHKAVNASLIGKVLAGEKVSIPMDDYLTAFEKRKAKTIK